MSRNGARFDGGSSSSGFCVLDNLSCISKRAFLSVNRNPRRCDSNCAISLMMSSNPAVQVSGRSHSCGQLGNMVLYRILCVCCRILLSAVGIASVGRFSSITVRQKHMKLWDFRCFSSSGWVVISPSLCSSQGACDRNSASLPQPSAVRGPLGFPVIMGFFSTHISSLSVWYAFCIATSEGMVSCSGMSCAHGSAVGVHAVCLLRK